MILDLHVHSSFSFDSLLKPHRILKVAKKRGLSGVAITDHGTIKGGLKTIAIKSGLMVIIGCEINTEVGDLIGLFLNEEIKSTRSLEVIDEIKDQDGIIVLPHPLKGHNIRQLLPNNLLKNNPKKRPIDEDMLAKMDIVEGFNARCGAYENMKAQALAKKFKMPIIGGSDAHFSCEIGNGRTIVKGIFDSEEIRKILLNGEIEIAGKHTPPYFTVASQAIKAVKTKNARELLMLSPNMVKGGIGYLRKSKNKTTARERPGEIL